MRAQACPLLIASLLAARGALAQAPPPATGGSPEPRLVVRSGTAMGTEVKISVHTSDPEDKVQPVLARAFDEIQRLEALMTTWRPDSEVSRINAEAGSSAVKVSPDTLAVIEEAVAAARRSEGAFDITFYSLRGLWRFDEDLTPAVPSAAKLRARLRHVGFNKIEIDKARSSVRLKDSGTQINLGGIAKGYAVDRAADLLRQAGYPNALIQAGGDLLCAGNKAGRPWKAGIRDPRGDRVEYFAAMALENHAFSTAGDYERFFILEGRRYHHILDPRTGRPATRSRSVTVYAPTALLADSLDDAIFVLGWKRGFEMLARIPDTGAVVVDDRGQVHLSPGMQGRVEILRPPTDAP